ncbi:hypothetical protein [Tumidithrix helvetica]|uniref:hypothetical protein n=1 Tax=Tumidithrix helvetica TaxID=3457545 RepID=UPI003CC6398F
MDRYSLQNPIAIGFCNVYCYAVGRILLSPRTPCDRLRNIFELLVVEQIFEYRKLKRTYGSAIAFNYAKLVVSAAYLYR